MAEDQVKYSELIKNDNNNFQGLLDALYRVREALIDLRSDAVNLRSSLAGVNTTTKQQQQSLSDDAASAENLNRRVKQLEEEEARLKAAIAEANRMTKLQGQLAAANAGSLNEMRAKYKLLVAEIGNYNLKSADGQRKMRAAAAEARRLREEIYKLESAYGQFGRNVGNYSGALGGFSNRLKEAAARFVAFNAAFLSFTGLVRFGKQLYETRKELESSLVIFKALAGEIQGAKLFEQMKEFAFTTPVTLNAAAKAVQTMLSFGVSQEKVIDIMSRLGDIAAGDGDRLQRLALAYSQATQAGRLMGQDTLQFINSGFNPLYYISLRTGKSMMELREEMQKAKIPIEMVTQAIVDATSEGGQFNGMLDKQKETMKGAANIMSGAWQNMLNEMGAGMQEGIVGMLKWMTSLMQNWRQTMRTLRQLAVSLGTAKVAMTLYRVAVEQSAAALETESAAAAINTAATEANAVAAGTATKAKLSWAGAINVVKAAWAGLTSALKRFAPFAIIAGVTMIAQKLLEVSNASKRAAQEIRQFEKDAAESVSGTVSQYQQLGREWKSLGSDQAERARWIEEHKRLFDELGASIQNAAEADRAFSEEGTAAYIDAIKRRAVADAYKERLAKATLRQQDAIDQMEALRGSGKAYVNVAGGTIGSSMTGAAFSSGGGTAMTAEYSKALNEYTKAVDEMIRIQHKIEDFEKGALSTTPGRAGSGPITTSATPEAEPTKTVKAVKDKIADLQTLLRALEDAQIANIDDEYDRSVEAELKRHERFVQDREAELALLSEEDPRRAVINQQIEEESTTHLNKMGALWEDYRKKQQEQEKKAAEQREKEAKGEAKTIYSALDDQWQRERTLLIGRGAKKKELIEAEIQAEIARLQTMLTVQRSLNGEIMTPEEKSRIEEWIRLLQNLAKAGNFGGVKSGQIFGHGASNIGGEKSHTWSNVIDLLTVDSSGNNRGWTSNLFGDMDDDAISRWKNGIAEAFNQAKDALKSWMDARKEAAAEARQQADDAVSTAENALDREIELRNQGYANDVALRERQLAEAQEAQKKAIEQQKRVAAQQQLIDAAMQTSSLVTASANIIKDMSKMGLAGVLASIGAIGAMWGTFAWAQTKAYQVTQKSTQFREGGVTLLEGGSHQSGHDINLGVGPDGSNLRAEGGEYFAVINKRNSRKYGQQIPDVVNALNSGMFEQRYIRTADAMGLMAGGATGEVASVDLSNVESGVSQLVKQGEKSWSTEGDYRVMRYKGLTRRIKL